MICSFSISFARQKKKVLKSFGLNSVSAGISWTLKVLQIQAKAKTETMCKQVKIHSETTHTKHVISDLLSDFGINKFIL